MSYKRLVRIGLTAPVVVIGSGSITSTNAFGEAYVDTFPPPDATIEQRVKALEDRVTGLRSQLETQREKTRKLAKAITDEAKSHADAVEQIKRQLKAKFVDGIALDLLGLWYFIWGVALATFPWPMW